MAHVLRPGGYLLAQEPITSAGRIDGVPMSMPEARHPDVGALLPGLVREVGLELVDAWAEAPAGAGPGPVATYLEELTEVGPGRRLRRPAAPRHRHRPRRLTAGRPARPLDSLARCRRTTPALDLAAREVRARSRFRARPRRGRAVSPRSPTGHAARRRAGLRVRPRARRSRSRDGAGRLALRSARTTTKPASPSSSPPTFLPISSQAPPAARPRGEPSQAGIAISASSSPPAAPPP